MTWTPAVDIALTHPSSQQCLPWLRSQVHSGTAQLWFCSSATHTAQLYVVTRLDASPTEWVICFVRGTRLDLFGPYFVAVARARGWPLRMHTESKATARLCQRLGFQLAEYVLRCDHGR